MKLINNLMMLDKFQGQERDIKRENSAFHHGTNKQITPCQNKARIFSERG